MKNTVTQKNKQNLVEESVICYHQAEKSMILLFRQKAMSLKQKND